MEIYTPVSQEVAIATKMWQLEKERKLIEEQAEELKLQYKDLAAELQTVLMDEGKSSTGHINGVGEFCLKRESYLSINKERLPNFIGLLKATGRASLVKEVIEPQTLKKHLSERQEELMDAMLAVGEEEALREQFDFMFDALYPTYVNSKAFETEKKGAPLELEELSGLALKLMGISVFQEIKLSHTKKGK